tara:strand:- start:645 stop:1163 length:519 start_codon:yes stop_codon:yes gene_type:complete
MKRPIDGFEAEIGLSSEGRAGWNCHAPNCDIAHTFQNHAEACKARHDKDAENKRLDPNAHKRASIAFAETIFVRGVPVAEVAKVAGLSYSRIVQRVSKVVRNGVSLHYRDCGQYAEEEARQRWQNSLRMWWSIMPKHWPSLKKERHADFLEVLLALCAVRKELKNKGLAKQK